MEEDVEGGAFEQNNYLDENMQGRLKAAGAAKGLKGHQHLNMQGESQRKKDTSMVDASGLANNNPIIADGGSYSSYLP